MGDADGAAARAGLASFRATAAADGAAAVKDDRVLEQPRALRTAAQEVRQAPPRILGCYCLRPSNPASSVTQDLAERNNC